MKLFSLSQPFLKVLGCGTFAALSLGLSSQAHAQLYPTYTTTFSSPTYTPNQTLDGQDSWSDSDTNEPDSVLAVDGFNTGPSDYSGLLGGAYLTSDPNTNGGPTTSPVYLSHGFNPVGSYAFNADFEILQSGSFFPNSNSFAFTFRTPTGNAFSIDFAPTSNSDATTYAVRYSVDGGGEVSTGVGIPTGQRFHLSLSVNEAGATPMLNFAVTGATGASPSASNVALGADAALITSFAATYLVAPTTTPGSNSIIFDNISAVPEPSTYAMLGLGILGLATRFRRKARA